VKGKSFELILNSFYSLKFNKNKKIFVLIVFSLVVLSLKSCVENSDKFVTDEISSVNEDIELSSQYPTSVVQDPPCDVSDYSGNFEPGNDKHNDTMLITLDNGCVFVLFRRFNR